MVTKVMPYKIVAFGLSDIGLVRENNEDVWAQVRNKDIFMLADGMGGHKAGEVAATATVNYFSAHMEEVLSSQPAEMSLMDAVAEIEYAIQVVNNSVYEMGCRDPDLRGMGTTFCCLYFHSQGLIHAHVGDSRIYRMRESKLVQLTKDHSLMRELIDLGRLDKSDEKEFVYKNIITKAVGTEPFVEPTVLSTNIVDKDLLLMCTDGLSDLLSDKEISAIMVQEWSLEDKVKKLIESAKEKGGHDNITVVMLEVREISQSDAHISR